jgi:protein-tyrosine phosphatase
VAAGFKPFFPGEFNYMVIQVLDMPFENLIRHFKSALDFIKSSIIGGGSVLVHCFAGVSRSASVVIAYLMREHGLPTLDAMTYVRKRRPIIFPNPGFQR